MSVFGAPPSSGINSNHSWKDLKEFSYFLFLVSLDTAKAVQLDEFQVRNTVLEVSRNISVMSFD